MLGATPFRPFQSDVQKLQAKVDYLERQDERRNILLVLFITLATVSTLLLLFP